MAIELVFRTAYFCVSLLLLFYSRTLVTSSAILALAAWLAFGHAPNNSTGQEVLVFFITWISAVAVAAVIGSTLNLTWMVDLELRMLSKQRVNVGVRDAMAWLMACAVATIAYAATDVANYDKGTFYRLQSLALLVLLLMIIYFYDQVAADDGYHLLPAAARHRHKLVAAVMGAAVSIDIIVRDPGSWTYLVPAGGVWLLLLARKMMVVVPTAPPHAKKSE